MLKILFIFAIASASSLTWAVNGHNGIKFDMTKKQIEAMGFSCVVPEDGTKDYLSECRHIEMSGNVFGFGTNNYKVKIGLNKRVATISADLLGIRTSEQYLELLVKVRDFFPVEDTFFSFHAETVDRYAFRAKDKSGISLLYSKGVEGYLNDTFRITFESPSYLSEIDKQKE